MGIHLRVLGELDLRGPDQTELHSVLAHPKWLALLTYLAVATPRCFHRRDSLMALLWPDQDAERARAALRQLLYGLRRSLGEGALLTRGEDVALDASAFDCDVWSFEEAAARGEAETAVRLHRGAFLNGFFLSEVPEFEQWVESERDRLDRTYAAMLERVAEEASSRDPAHAVECWRRLAEHDPYSPRIAVRLMQALEAAGDGPAAIRHAERHAALLRAELNAEPDPEVSALADRLRRRPAGPADPSNPGADFAAASTNPSSTLPVLADAEGRQSSGLWTRLGPFLAAVFAVAAGMALWERLRPDEPQPVARYDLALPPGQQFVDMSSRGFDVAPGAAAIVYTGPGESSLARLWVKEQGQLEARPLPGTEGALSPAISPGATEVVFNAGGQLRKVSLQGGAPVKLADSGSSATWMEDGSLVYQARHRLRRIPAAGGASEELWPEQPGNRWAAFPAALPDSRGVLFRLCDANCATVRDIWVLDLRSGQARKLITGALQAWYLDPGYVVFIRPDGVVSALPFDVGALEPTGSAVPLLEGVKIDLQLFPYMALKPDGTLLMLLGASGFVENREMVWVTRGGDVKQVDPGWRFANARNAGWSLSRDGTRLAIGIHTDEGDDIWI
ncbi:MAG: hypothetical protein FIA95_05815 [Gemmatimonadetes bacterium]|nr:hypothetical protein [Gemmatimonadota bacterium]